MLKRKFNFSTKPISKRFKGFKVLTKSEKALKKLVSSNEKLKGAIKTVFSKKGLKVAAAGAIIGTGVAHIWNYIESNSGCFKKKSDGSVCKYQELSCCQNGKLDNVPFCDGMEKLANVCKDFNEDDENSCCRLCDCKYVNNCLPGDTMKCQRPTVADALNHFATQVGSTVWSGIGTVFPWISYVLYGFVAIFVIWIISYIRSFFWMIRKKDV